MTAPLVPLLGSLALLGQTTGDAFVVEGARVFDGTRTLAASSVYCAGGRIQAVGTDVEAPDSVRVIDGSDRTLLPGLIDCHTHVRQRADLQQALVFGVTTELDFARGSLPWMR